MLISRLSLFKPYLVLCSLRRRFRQNQEDCTFVLLAQLPTLSSQLFAELDVEALTAELQRRAEVAKRDKQPTNALESSTTSLEASTYLETGPEASNGEAHLASSVQSTHEAAQVPLPQDGEHEATGNDSSETVSAFRLSFIISYLWSANANVSVKSPLPLWTLVQRRNCGKLSRFRVSAPNQLAGVKLNG